MTNGREREGRVVLVGLGATAFALAVAVTGCATTVTRPRMDGHGTRVPVGVGDPRRLAGFLASDPGYTLDDDRLLLRDDGTSIDLLDRRVADPDRPLEGTIWRLDGIIDGDAVSSVPGDVRATLRFTDRQVAIDVRGCSNGSARVSP